VKLIPFLILVLLFSQRSFSQESAYKNMPLVVIAPNGLKLREGPGTQYKTITVAPFGTDVFLIEVTDMPHDTVQRFSKRYSPEYVEHTNVQATWMKVRFGEKQGYMYSLYLIPGCHYSNPPDYVHPVVNYQIFSHKNSSSCEVYQSPKSNYWYEIIHNEDGSHSLNKINVELTSNYFLDECRIGESSWHLIVQNENREHNGPILYSRKKLVTGKLNSLPTNDLNEQFRSIHELRNYGRINSIEHSALKNKLLEKYSLGLTYEQNQASKLHYKKNGKKYGFPWGDDITNISMAADLDSDGIMDFIITFGSEHQTNTGLYLSSEADQDKSHKLVAKFHDNTFCYE
jgi:hypothetical protein